MAVSSPMHLFQKHIIAQIRTFDLIVEEKLELLPRRVGRCTPMTTDGKRPHALAYFSAVGSSLPSSQPANRPDINPSPAPSTLNTQSQNPGLTDLHQSCCDFLFEDYCPSCATLADQSSGCDRAQPSTQILYLCCHRQYEILLLCLQSIETSAASIAAFQLPFVIQQNGFHHRRGLPPPQIRSVININAVFSPASLAIVRAFKVAASTCGWLSECPSPQLHGLAE